MSVGGVGNTGGSQYVGGMPATDVTGKTGKLFTGANVTSATAAGQAGGVGGDTGDLANPAAEPPVQDYLGASGNQAASRKASEPLNLNAVMKVLYQTAMELREANKEIRHAERDIAMDQSYQAADKIRSGAVKSLVTSVVAGAVTIGMGMASSVQGSRQLKEVAQPMTASNQAYAKLRTAEADVELGHSAKDLQSAQLELDNAKAARTPKPAETPDAPGGPDVPDGPDAAKTAPAQDAPDADPAKAKAAETDAAEAEVKAAGEAEADAAGAVKTEGEAGEAAKTEGDAGDAGKAETKTEGDAADTGKAEADAGDAAKTEATTEMGEEKIAQLEKNVETARTRFDEAQKNSLKLNDREGRVFGGQDKVDRAARANTIKNADKMDADALDQMIGDAEAELPGLREQYSLAKGKLDAVQANVQLKIGFMQGLNSAAGGLGQIISSSGDLAASGDQAVGKEHEAQSTQAASEESEAAEVQESFNSLIQSVMDVIKSVNESNNEISKAVYQNM